MDTLRRVGSLRISKRGRHKADRRATNAGLAEDDAVGGGGETAGSPFVRPQKGLGIYASLRRREVAARAYFTISCKDVQVSTLNGYQPTHLRVTIDRRRKSCCSESVLWEPSLKCTSAGTGVWHPPFEVIIEITVPKFAKSSKNAASSSAAAPLLRHKDVYVSLENVDHKGKKKLLAKSRLNLSEYYESAAETDVSFRLKLHPESSKVAASSLDLTLRKSIVDPRKSVSNVAPCLEEDDNVPLGDDRLTAPIVKSIGSTPRGSVCGDKKLVEDLPEGPEVVAELDLDKEDDVVVVEEKPLPKPNVEPPKLPARLEKQEDLDQVVKNKAVQDALGVDQAKVLATPPPLPPRSRLVSQDTPPLASGRLSTDTAITSTPLSKDLDNEPKVKTPEKEAPPTNPLYLSTSPSRQATATLPIDKMDWSDDKNNDEQQQQPMRLNLSACASPKLKPHKQDSMEQNLLSWAKERLQDQSKTKNAPYVKVTNLSSSWRNGVGFCAIIGAKHPDLVPLADMTASSFDNVKNNNEIAFDAADILGVDTESIRKMTQNSKTTEKNAVVIFLTELRSVLEDGNNVSIASDILAKHHKKWRKKSGYFKDSKTSVSEVKTQKQIKEPSPVRDRSTNSPAKRLVRHVSEEEDSILEGLSEASEATTNTGREITPVKPEEVLATDDIVVDNDENGDGSEVTTPTGVIPEALQCDEAEESTPKKTNRERVMDLIAQAHNREGSRDSSSYEEPLSTSSSNGGISSTLPESKTISEELSQLAMAEEQLAKEKEKMQLALRDPKIMEDADESDIEAMLQKWMHLVNEKNSLVRRQMQLNIAEKEKAIEHEKETLQRRLQKFTDLDDSQKTEAMRSEEAELLEQYIEAVNKKNELLLDLDSQEKLIEEDERIQNLIANRDLVTLKKEEECVIQ